MELESKELLNKGITYIASGNFEEAVDTFKKAIELNNKDYELYIHLGNAYANMHKFDEAITAFKTALMLKPNDGEIYFTIGSAYYLDNKYGEAIKAFNKAEELGYCTIGLYKMRAAIFIQANDLEQGIREFSKALSLNPLDADLYQKKMLLQLQLKQVDDAIDTMETFREYMPDALDAYDLSTQVYSARNEYAKAQKVIDEGLKRFPEDPRMCFIQLRIYAESQQNEKAKTYGEKIWDMEMSDALRKEIAIYLAQVYGELGLEKEIYNILEETNGKMQDATIKYLLMPLYVHKKEYEKVKQISSELQEMKTTDAVRAAAKFSYADAVKNLEGTEAAKEIYKGLAKEFRRISIDKPELYEVYIYRIVCHTELNEYDKALELCDFIEKTQPTLVDGPLYKYYVYHNSGDDVKAEIEKQKVLKINPDIVF